MADGIRIYELSREVLISMPVAEALEAYVQGDAFDADQISCFMKAMEDRLRVDIDGPQWCRVCRSYHRSPGIKTDAGALEHPCWKLGPHDPRNRWDA